MNGPLPAAENRVVTRFAPSPTGLLHLGHALAAVEAHRSAAEGRGKFLVRIEDIDFTRCRSEFEAAIFEDLNWLGLIWEEPVWRQSGRMPVYQEALDKLDALGVLYPCFCTRQEINAASAPQGPEGLVYPGTCRAMNRDEREGRLAAGAPCAFRLDSALAAALTGPLVWFDHHAGVQQTDPALLGDVVLARRDIATSYHLAVTVDDAAQGVTLVTRGTDLFTSTHVHRLLQALLGLPVPEWRHHRLVCNEEGRRLAKRDNARTLQSLRAAGHTRTEVLRMIGRND